MFEIYAVFAETYCLHLRDRRVIKARILTLKIDAVSSSETSGSFYEIILYIVTATRTSSLTSKCLNCLVMGPNDEKVIRKFLN
jgi:hypothetical protein